MPSEISASGKSEARCAAELPLEGDLGFPSRPRRCSTCAPVGPVPSSRRIRPLRANRSEPSHRGAPSGRHLRTPSVSLAPRRFRAACCARDHAVFRRESFTRRHPVEPVFPPLRPPAPFGWKGLPDAAGSDVPCRTNGWSRGFRARHLAAADPKVFDRRRPHQDRSSLERVRPRDSPSRTPSIDFIPTRGRK